MTTYAGTQRKTALALWGAVGSLGVAAGVLVGGALTTWASWQAIFWVNVPVGVVALLVGQRIIVKDTAPRPSLRRLRPPRRPGRHRRVWRPSSTGSAAPRPTAGGRSAPWRRSSVSAVLLAAFLRLEKRAARPLFPPHIWKLQALVSGTVVMLGVTGILVGTVFLTSIFVQTVLGFSALETGLAFLPFALAITVGTLVARHLLDHLSPRVIATAGLLVTAAASVLALHRRRRARTSRPTSSPGSSPSASGSAWCSSRSR